MIGEHTAQRHIVLTEVEIGQPVAGDGAALWRIARGSQVLDLNSSYSYLLWCRDFAASSVVARREGRPVGFVTGYVRPDAADTVVVWQVAVDGAQRGRGVAGRMLDALVDRLAPRGVRFLETTITADNAASRRLFSAFAEGRGASLERAPLFAAELFPDGHAAEDLYRIGPMPAP